MTSSIRVGAAPDSWGVWFPDDPQQTPYTRFLDEVVASGYAWIELGPYGYLPTDPEWLRDELGSRGLRLSAGTVFERLHQQDSWSAIWSQIEDVAKLTAAVGGSHVVVIPEMWRDAKAFPTFLHSSMPSSGLASTCSRSSSRTCTRARPTLPCRSPDARATTSVAAA